MPVHQQNAVLLPRLLGLRDYTPFVLVLDSIAQSADYLILEFLHRIPQETNVVFLSFETVQPPSLTDKKISFVDVSNTEISKISSVLSSHVSSQKKNVVILDSLSHIPAERMSEFVMSIFRPNTTIMAVYHTSIPLEAAKNPYYPNPLNLLHFLATSSIMVMPIQGNEHLEEEREKEVDRLMIPMNCNTPKFQVTLTHRRRSGRSISADYTVNFTDHNIEYLVQKQQEVQQEDESMLAGLTTFNLSTTDKQKQAKDSVELPFFKAQEFGDGGAQGGAIIYQYEKDDDYDEEDPYEDPF
uniref:Elongator complex protein 5 n=1 Tax=Blastobotrys adeninivorans TaxID=409370 RepID=A0A060T6U9_BLAAD